MKIRADKDADRRLIDTIVVYTVLGTIEQCDGSDYNVLGIASRRLIYTCM